MRAENDKRAAHGLVTAVTPTFTNPNNVAIVTGVPASMNGICGNHFYDEALGQEVSMTDPELLRCDTILQHMSHAGVKVLVVTAKHKLLPLLSKGLHQDSVALSVEQADSQEATAALEACSVEGGVRGLMGGRAAPDIYDPDVSIYALEMGLRFLQAQRERGEDSQPHLLYLSTTDYVQHKHRPGTAEANAFYAQIDRVMGEFHDFGAVVGATADHGMNDKTRFDGSPRVTYLEPFLQQAGATGRVVLPITDPYVKHHASLGSYATIYLDDKSAVDRVMMLLRQQQGVYTVLNNDEACRTFELPNDRVGDIVVVGDEYTVLGKSAEYHDLAEVHGLRSHGGMEEAMVPMFFTAPLTHAMRKKLGRGKSRNYDLFDFLCNGIA